MNSRDAREALAQVGEARERLATEIDNCPPWRHAAFGLVFALLIGSLSTPLPFQMAGTIAGLALVAVLVVHDRRRYGVFVNGYRRGRTLPITFLFLAILAVLAFAALHAREAALSGWTKGAIAVLAFALSTWASVVWQRVFARELREGRA